MTNLHLAITLTIWVVCTAVSCWATYGIGYSTGRRNGFREGADYTISLLKKK